MARQKTGAAIPKWKVRGGKRVKQWYACVTYWEADARRFWTKKPKENTKTSARNLAKEMLAELDGRGRKAIDSANMTFSDLAEFFEETILIEPEYVDGRKVAGYRGRYVMQINLKILTSYFGKRKLKELTHGDLKKFKAVRLKTPTVFGRNTRTGEKTGKEVKRQRSIATVHKELNLLRRVLNVAVSNGWLVKNPFEQGEALINPADERQRERILTREEEEKLLSVCTGASSHLKPIIILALDTGMRRGEIFKLKWQDVDLERRVFNIEAWNTKTMRERQVGITSRLAQALSEWLTFLGRTPEPDELVFGIANCKKAFAKAALRAGLADLHFHDLRHTSATRATAKGLPLAEVGRILGHTQVRTTYRYVNADEQTLQRHTAMMDEFNEDVKPDTIN